MDLGKEPVLRLASSNDTACRASKLAARSALVAVLGLAAGCETKSFLDPSEVGRFKREPLAVRIVDHVDPAMESPKTEFVYATPPTNADMDVTTEDYAISANDLLGISISDLQGPGVDTVVQKRVTASGNISL